MDEMQGSLQQERGFWLDLRSKRDIQSSHLVRDTTAEFNFYDPLLTPKVGVVDLSGRLDWLDPSPPRSWQLNLHSFRFADYWILAYISDGDEDRLVRLEQVALDYIAQVWNGRRKLDFEFICCDVSVASRAAVFAYLLGRAAAGEYTSRNRRALSRALEEHVVWAVADENYNSNNHGLFNDMHLLLALANAPDQRCLVDSADAIRDRLLSTYLVAQINREGVHLEHTPAYALLWVLLGQKIQRILGVLSHRIGMFADADKKIDDALTQVKSGLWWFTKPNGELINLGDQGRTEAPKWVKELPGANGCKLFAESGYAFYKSASSYLAFACAYHATKSGREGYRAASHKQRDELQVLWSEGGRDILIDTGLRGYDFGPERRFTFSKQAHNTLSIHEGDYLKGGIIEYMDATAPYGSGVYHSEACAGGSGWVVMAGYDPLLSRLGVRHHRLVLLEPGSWLVVCDVVRLSSGSRAEWNFHIHEDWRCLAHSTEGATLRAEDGAELKMSRWCDDLPSSEKAFLHRGDFEPLRGWRFAGDPVAVNNLRFAQWVRPGARRIFATGFSVRGGKVKNIRLLSSAAGIIVYLTLDEPAGAREVEICAPQVLPDDLLS